jgi:riboflavin biosynthesis pyrimidine reductase
MPPAAPLRAQLLTLYDRSPEAAQPTLTGPLQVLYGGDLAFPPHPDRPHVVANFVQTIDGVVSYAIPGRAGGGEISGFDAADRFVMGLLRSCADAVMVASGTLHADSGHVRTPGFICPEAAGLYAELRSARSRDPLNVIVTGSGRVDLTEATFHTPGLETLIVTTEDGERRLRSEHGQRLRVTRVRAVAEAGLVPPAEVLGVLRREFGVGVLLHEGGPRLLGAFLAARAIDELFLTLAPQVAGRGAVPRPGIAEGAAFLPETAPWFDLQSVKRAGNHLLLRLSVRP